MPEPPRTDLPMADLTAPDRASGRSRLRRQVGLLAVATLAVAALGLASGWLFAKGQPRAAAGALVADFVVDEAPGVVAADGRGDPVDELPPPSWGPFADGTVRCGLLEGLAPADHLATLASGLVVVRHRADLPDDDLAVLAELATRPGVAVAPEPRLDDAVVALAWGRRMPLDAVNRELLVAFATANLGRPTPLATAPTSSFALPSTCPGA